MQPPICCRAILLAHGRCYCHCGIMLADVIAILFIFLADVIALCFCLAGVIAKVADVIATVQLG